MTFNFDLDLSPLDFLKIRRLDNDVKASLFIDTFHYFLSYFISN